MNTQQIIGALRVLIPSLLGMFSGFGVIHLTAAQIDATTANLINLGTGLAGVVTAGAALYSILAHTAKAQVSAVAELPDVKKVVLTQQADANEHPSDKIVGPTGKPQA